MLGFSSLVRSGRQWEIVLYFFFCFFFVCALFKARRDVAACAVSARLDRAVDMCDVSTCALSARLDRAVDMSASSLSECTERTEDKPSRIPLLPESEPGFEPLLL